MPSRMHAAVTCCIAVATDSSTPDRASWSLELVQILRKHYRCEGDTFNVLSKTEGGWWRGAREAEDVRREGTRTLRAPLRWKTKSVM